jgi:hypothetical protein
MRERHISGVPSLSGPDGGKASRGAILEECNDPLALPGIGHRDIGVRFETGREIVNPGTGGIWKRVTRSIQENKDVVRGVRGISFPDKFQQSTRICAEFVEGHERSSV